MNKNALTEVYVVVCTSILQGDPYSTTYVFTHHALAERHMNNLITQFYETDALAEDEDAAVEEYVDYWRAYKKSNPAANQYIIEIQKQDLDAED